MRTAAANPRTRAARTDQVRAFVYLRWCRRGDHNPEYTRNVDGDARRVLTSPPGSPRMHEPAKSSEAACGGAGRREPPLQITARDQSFMISGSIRHAVQA